MTFHLGVDLGTTYTAAAVHRAGKVEVFGLGLRAPVIPSVVFLREDHEVLTGDAAARRGQTEPGRVAREFKRRIGDTTPLLLGGSPYSAEALSAELLRWVVRTVSQQEDGQPEQTVLCHPANWGEYKKGLLEQAVQIADLRDVRFVTEPEAAAVYYASQERVEAGTTIAVYDLGGGTFDATVLRKHESGWDVLGEPQGIERLGGIDFDEALFQHVVAQLDGKEQELDLDDPVATAALSRLRQDVVEAKEALSSDTQVSIAVVLPNVQTEIRVNRVEFEDMIRPPLQNTLGALHRSLESAGVTPDGISKVLLVGGSSRIPLVSQMVGAELGRPVGVDTHPKHAVPLGAALLAADSTQSASVAVDAGDETPRPAMGAPVVATPAEPPPSERPPSGSAAHAEVASPDRPPAPRAAASRSPRRLRSFGIAALVLTVIAAVVGIALARGDNNGENTGDGLATDELAVVASGDLGGQIEELVVDGGAVWVTDSANGQLIQVDVGTNDVAATVALDGAPAGMTFANGALWVAVPDASALERVDPSTGEVTNTIDIPGGPVEVAAAEGFLWVLDRSGTLSRITPNSDEDVATFDLAAEEIGTDELVAGEGFVWVAEAAGRLFKIDPFDLVVADAIETGGEGIDGLAAGFNDIWIGLEGGAVSRVDPGTLEILARIEIDAEPRDIAVGGGALWVAHIDGSGVTRINPDTEAVTAALDLEFAPREIGFGEGSAWAVSLDGRMSRVDSP